MFRYIVLTLKGESVPAEGKLAMAKEVVIQAIIEKCPLVGVSGKYLVPGRTGADI